jgi:hypothetical protein
MSKHRNIDEVLADLEDVAVNFDKGWRAEPSTMAALVRRISREVKVAVEKVREDERAYAFKLHEF